MNPALCAMVSYTERELFASNISVLYVDPAERKKLLANYDRRPQGTPIDVLGGAKTVDVITRASGCTPIAMSPAPFNTSTATSKTSHPFAPPNRRFANPRSSPRSASSSPASRTSSKPTFGDSALHGGSARIRAVDRGTEALGIIAQQARRSRAIVRDLLSFVRSREVIRRLVRPRLFLGQVKRTLQRSSRARRNDARGCAL